MLLAIDAVGRGIAAVVRHPIVVVAVPDAVSPGMAIVLQLRYWSGSRGGCDGSRGSYGSGSCC